MKDQNMKIGILGGSFNPVHNGHLELAKQALAQFALDQIWLMPNHIPAYKKWDRSVTNEDRLHMLELAVKDHDGLRCSDLELQRGGVTYTIDTLAQLHEQYPDTEWYFIMGGDSILVFDTWREPDRILSLSKLIVTTRDQIQAEDVDAKIRHLKKLCCIPEARRCSGSITGSSCAIQHIFWRRISDRCRSIRLMCHRPASGKPLKMDRIYQEPYQWQYTAILRNMGYIRRMKTLIKTLINR